MIETILGDSPELITAMHVDGGGFAKVSSNQWVINRIIFTAKFLEQPTGRFYESNHTSGSSADPNAILNLKHGQTSCQIEDNAANVGTTPSAYTFDLIDWHDYEIYVATESTDMVIKVDSSTERTSVVLNGWIADVNLRYNWYIFDTAKLYIKDMQVYVSQTLGGQALQYNWDFEGGAGVPGNWTNSTIAYVIG